MKHKLLYLLLTILLAGVFSPLAAKDEPTAQERRQWVEEMQNYKKEYIAKALQLTDDQKAKFFPLYIAMDNELRAINDQVRKEVRAVAGKKAAATDADYARAAELMYNAKSREGAVEKKYYDKFKTILTQRQLFELKRAEHRLAKEMMQHSQKSDKPKPKPTKKK